MSKNRTKSGNKNAGPFKNERGSKESSQNCRCKCASVCYIKGPTTIKVDKKKKYEIEVDIAKNKGCRSSCSHDKTEWSASGGSVGHEATIEKESRTSVEVKCAKTGHFQLSARITTTCTCKGTPKVTRACSLGADMLTITVTS